MGKTKPQAATQIVKPGDIGVVTGIGRVLGVNHEHGTFIYTYTVIAMVYTRVRLSAEPVSPIHCNESESSASEKQKNWALHTERATPELGRNL